MFSQVVNAVPFVDSRKWGQSSFLDYLESNGVQFEYDGQQLEFNNQEAYQRAVSIWHCLTGQTKIGVVG